MLWILLQKLLPKRWITRVAGRLARSQSQRLKNFLIASFIRYYGVNLAEAVIEDYKAYPSFQAFFTRLLKPEVRPLVLDEKKILAPCDGAVSACGKIQQGQLFQAKHHLYRLADLLAEDDSSFHSGYFLTAYLSPKDYHRVHMPLAGKLKKTVYVPGALFSVNAQTVAHLPGLFAKNERLIAHFETNWGPFAVIMVGAMVVAGIETVWDQAVRALQVTHKEYEGQSIVLPQGAEMGRFGLGSTVILLFPPAFALQWQAHLKAGEPIRLFERLGDLQL